MSQEGFQTRFAISVYDNLRLSIRIIQNDFLISTDFVSDFMISTKYELISLISLISDFKH